MPVTQQDVLDEQMKLVKIQLLHEEALFQEKMSLLQHERATTGPIGSLRDGSWLDQENLFDNVKDVEPSPPSSGKVGLLGG